MINLLIFDAYGLTLYLITFSSCCYFKSVPSLIHSTSWKRRHRRRRWQRRQIFDVTFVVRQCRVFEWNTYLPPDACTREVLLRGKVQYSWPPVFGSAAFVNSNFTYFFTKQATLMRSNVLCLLFQWVFPVCTIKTF